MRGWWGLVGAVAACTDLEPPEFPRACDRSEDDGYCILYSGEAWTSADVQGECVGGQLAIACPDGELGRCLIDGTLSVESISWLYNGFWDESHAIEDCEEMSGSWMPSP